MCDYSLESVKSRAAVKGDRLVTRNFGCGTYGFAEEGVTAEIGTSGTAICLLPGTELAFDAPVQVRAWTKWGQDCVAIDHPAKTIEHRVARFTKVNPDEMFKHHDGLEFPDHLGVFPVLLTHLVEGQTATVIQLPADPEAAKALDEATRKVPEYTD